MKVNKNTDPREIFKSMHSELDAIGKGLEKGKLSNNDLDEIKAEFEKTILEAYKVKFGLRLDSLAKKEAHLSSKDVLVKMLDLLPSDVNPDFLPILTNYVIDSWKTIPQKLAA